MRGITKKGGLGFISMQENVPGIPGEGFLNTPQGQMYFSLHGFDEYNQLLTRAGFDVVDSYRSVVQTCGGISPVFLNYIVKNK